MRSSRSRGAEFPWSRRRLASPSIASSKLRSKTSAIGPSRGAVRRRRAWPRSRGMCAGRARARGGGRLGPQTAIRLAQAPSTSSSRLGRRRSGCLRRPGCCARAAIYRRRARSWRRSGSGSRRLRQDVTLRRNAVRPEERSSLHGPASAPSAAGQPDRGRGRRRRSPRRWAGHSSNARVAPLRPATAATALRGPGARGGGSRRPLPGRRRSAGARVASASS